MRINEIVKESSEDLYLAVQNWLEMEFTDDSVDTILANPNSQLYKTPPHINYVYRALVLNDDDINNIHSTRTIIAYSTDINGAHGFLATLDILDDYIIVRKKFKSSDFILDFDRLQADVIGFSPNIPENEIWMKSTAYYTTFNQSEIVYDSSKDQS